MWSYLICLSGLVLQAKSLIIANDQNNKTMKFQDYEAEFGTMIGDIGLVGVLVSADPPDACQPIKPRPYDTDDDMFMNTFVLIERGSCDFAIKVLHAQEANYNAAIVYNVGSDELLHMGTFFPRLEKEIHIPSVFVGETSGKILNDSYIYSLPSEPYVKIDHFEAPFSFKLYLIPFMAVVGCSFLILVCFVVVRALRERRRRMRSRLSRQRLKQLPSKQFQKGDEYDVCAICLDEYEEGDTLRILPCKHAYHSKCVDPWLTTTKRVCPLCKRRVLSDDDASDASDDYDDDDSETNEEAPLLGRSSVTSSRSHNNGGGATSSHHYGSDDMTSPYNNHIRSFVPTSATPLLPPESTAAPPQQPPQGPQMLARSAPTTSSATDVDQIFATATTSTAIPVQIDSTAPVNHSISSNNSSIGSILSTPPSRSELFEPSLHTSTIEGSPLDHVMEPSSSSFNEVQSSSTPNCSSPSQVSSQTFISCTSSTPQQSTTSTNNIMDFTNDSFEADTTPQESDK